MTPAALFEGKSMEARGVGYSYGQYSECVGWGTPDGIGAF
jgi:hypothetical protein